MPSVSVRSWRCQPKVIRIPMVSLSWNKFWNKFKSIGIFFPYIKESLDVNNTTTSLIFSIMMFFQYCGSLIGRDSNINYYQSDWFNPKDSDYSSLIESVINYLSWIIWSFRLFWALTPMGPTVHSKDVNNCFDIVLMITPTPFADSKIFFIQVRHSGLYFHFQ